MSSKSKRRPPIPPRPQVIPEHLRAEVRSTMGNTPQVLDRQQCMEFSVMLAANLERLLNGDKRLPWVQASIEKRTDGFSLHVQVVQPTSDVDAVVL